MMLPAAENPAVLLQGDVLDVLRQLPDGSVHCCVTSPPYWGLRDYGVAGQLGLEKTPAEYVASITDVFREVKRVLRNDGTLWLNIGDSYAASGKGGNPAGSPHKMQASNAGSLIDGRRQPPAQFKPKDLVGIPWRLAFALQADGWYLRSDVIWHKPNAMPESVTDRPSKAHEYLFLFSKRARYFYDGEAVREPHVRVWDAEKNGGSLGRNGDDKLIAQNNHKGPPAAPNPNGRNRRSVWSIVSDPYPEAHFATFPPALVEPCIRAGTSLHGCCPACGGPWKRVVEKTTRATRPGTNSKVPKEHWAYSADKDHLAVGNRDPERHVTDVRTTGWEPSCRCDRPDVQPCVVLDPFVGSGTTLQVALQLDRWGIGIDLNADYLKLAEKRIRGPAGIGGLFPPAAPTACDMFAHAKGS